MGHAMFEKKVTDLHTLSEEEAEVIRHNNRRTEAAGAEKQAVELAAQADQFTAMRERTPDRENIDEEVVNRVRSAKAARERADALHELAGTTPEDFRGEIVEGFRTQLQGLEVGLVRSVDRAEHPDAFASGAETKKSLTHHAVMDEEAVLSTRRAIAKLDPAGEFAGEDDGEED